MEPNVSSLLVAALRQALDEDDPKNYTYVQTLFHQLDENLTNGEPLPEDWK